MKRADETTQGREQFAACRWTAELPFRAVRASPILAAVVKSSPIQRIIQTFRAARRVSPAGRFVLRQLFGGGVRDYRLRLTGTLVHVRHGTRDIDVLNEIFGGVRGDYSYEPPAEVRAALDGADELRIVDLGGNIGLFGLFAMNRWRTARIDSFEPDPGNAALLRATIEANGFAGRWMLHQMAVSNTAGKMPFWAGLFSESRIALPDQTTAAVEMSDLFELELGDVDLLKMDIEGSEWAILGDPRFAMHPARALLIEWHAWMCPGERPHETARQLISKAGWRVVLDAPSDTGPVGLIWALRD